MNKSLFPENASQVVGTVTTREVWNDLERHAPECDLFEWRVDALQEFLVLREMLSRTSPLPVLVTVRCPEEGGIGNLSLEERRLWYRELLPVASFIDIEIAYLEPLADIVEQARSQNIGVIASAHNFSGIFTLEQMTEGARKARSLGADAVKFAYLAEAEEDVDHGMQALSSSEIGRPFIVMGMGRQGPDSRLRYARSGSAFTYGYLGTEPSAPGQLPAAKFKELLS